MAGRKKVAKKRRNKGFTLSEETCEILGQKENQSAYIEALILKDAKTKKLANQ